MTNTTKSGMVALIGRPNVGKSTLMNHLIGQKIAITSRKPQTTRNRIMTVYTESRGQIVFMDTPGIHQAKNRLGQYMVTAAYATIADADAILWLVEPDVKIGHLDSHILEALKKAGSPVILVINKADKVKKTEIPAIIDAWRTKKEFDDIIPVSALLGRNLDTLIDVLFKYLPYGPMYYDEDTVTDQPVRAIAAEIIREKALRCLGEEVPHGIAVVIDQMEERDDGLWQIDASIVCEKDSHKGIIIGKGGAKLKEIGSLSRPDIEDLIGSRVNLKLWVKVRRGWRDSDLYMKNYGYDSQSI